ELERSDDVMRLGLDHHLRFPAELGQAFGGVAGGELEDGRTPGGDQQGPGRAMNWIWVRQAKRFVILRYSEGSGHLVGWRRSFGVPQDDICRRFGAIWSAMIVEVVRDRFRADGRVV